MQVIYICVLLYKLVYTSYKLAFNSQYRDGVEKAGHPPGVFHYLLLPHPSQVSPTLSQFLYVTYTCMLLNTRVCVLYTRVYVSYIRVYCYVHVYVPVMHVYKTVSTDLERDKLVTLLEAFVICSSLTRLRLRTPP